MQSNLEDKTQTTKYITLDIPVEEYEPVYNEIIQNYSQKAKIKGFRPGKVPRNILLKLFKQNINDDLIFKVVSPKVNKIFTDYSISPVTTPVVESFNIIPGKDISVKVTFESVPDFDIPSLDTLQLDQYISNVTDEMIDKGIAAIRESIASYIDAEPDYKVSIGNLVEVGFRINDIKNPVPIKNINLTTKNLNINSDEGINKYLIGQRIHDVVQVPMDDDKDESENTKFYEIHINKIMLPVLPDLDDEMAKDLGYPSVTDLPSLREYVKQFIFEQQENEAKDYLTNQIMLTFDKEIDLPIPNLLIEQEIDYLITNYKADYDKKPNIRTSGTLEDWLKNPEMRDNFRSQAKLQVKNSLILKKVAKENNITVSKEEVEDAITKLSAYGSTKDLENSFKKEEFLEYFHNNLLSNKAIDLIISRAQITQKQRPKRGENTDFSENGALDEAQTPQAE